MLYKITGLKRVFGTRTVLDIDYLELEKGKVYTLTGPNGAGKSTLLNIISFLDKPTEGTIELMGKKVVWTTDGMTACRKQVVLLDQYPIMFSGTVANNVAYGLKVRKTPKDEIQKRVTEMLDLVGMSKFADAEASLLSGGETKRVALARALAVSPEVLICDEPSANVDNENQEMILRALDNINREKGTTIIFSTHYLSQGYRLADKKLLLQNGKLSDVVNENVYRVQVLEGTGDKAICVLAEGIHLAVAREKVPDDQQEIKLWLDPRKIEFALENADSAEHLDNTIVGTLVEVTQEKSLVELCVDAGVRITVHLEYQQYRAVAPLLGDKIVLTVPQDAIYCTLL